MKYIIIVAVIFLLMSVVAFISYGADKRKAKKKVWRTKEAVLLGLGFWGGAIGALLGMNVFRHKTQHWYFWVVNVLGLAWQITLLVFLIFKFAI